MIHDEQPPLPLPPAGPKVGITLYELVVIGHPAASAQRKSKAVNPGCEEHCATVPQPHGNLSGSALRLTCSLKRAIVIVVRRRYPASCQAAASKGCAGRTIFARRKQEHERDG